MAKVQSAIITAAIIKTRQRADGGHPIVIRVQFNGRAEKYLPHSCPLEAWDERKAKVKTSYRGASLVNASIAKEIAKAEQRKQWYEAHGQAYTAKMLLNDEYGDVNNGNSLVYKNLMEDLLRVKHYSDHTVISYTYSWNVLQEYVHDDDFCVLSLTPAFCEGLARWLSKTRSAASVKAIMARYGVVYRHGIEKGLIDELQNPHPYKKYKYWTTYKADSKKLGLTAELIEMLENDYVNRVTQVDEFEGTWQYRKDAFDELMAKRSSLNFCQCLCLMCYKMQGLALCDLLRIRKENVTRQKVGEDEYYLFTNVKRKKTKQSIDVISVKVNDVNAVIFDAFFETMDERDGWFLPCMYVSKAKPDNVVQAVTELTNAKIPLIFKRIDEENDNVVKNTGIDVSKVTYYTFRHTFASVYVNEKGGNPVYLAEMMGRSVNNIFTYVNGLNSIESLIREKNKLDD